MRGAMAARRIPDPKVAGSIPVVFTDIRCSIVASIPACHAGDPGSIPGRGVAFGLLLLLQIRSLVAAESKMHVRQH